MEEIWKDIPNYDGYQVSNLGRVRTFNKVTFTQRHGFRHWKNRILSFKKEYYSARKNQKGMGMGNRVDLWKNGKPHTLLVHRLVATTFLENLIDTKMTVNHKDGNRYNNNVENLEWISLADNIRYGYEHGQYRVKKSIILVKNNNKYFFDSFAKASKFLGRCSSYVSGKLKKGKKDMFALNGEKYDAVLEEVIV